MSEITFIVTEEPDGGFVASAVCHRIYTQADNLEELHETVRDAVRCHFEPEQPAAKFIHLHFVRDETIAA